MNAADPGFGVYLHWPFCAAKCPYCDFNSHVRHQPPDQARFAAAFRRELEHFRERTGPREVTSIFLGGGTPSLMEPDTVGALLETVAELWTVPNGIEITLEANPSSVEAARFAGIASAGVNRVSLGLQALDDAALRFLGRLHDSREGLAALDVAQGVFNRVNADFIYARPQQSAENWEAELNRVLDLGTDHLSLYQLTIEQGTRFATDVRVGTFTPLADDPAADLFELTRELTAAAGLPAYEISNHARPGQESRHNLAYWRYRDYAGIGPGAHGRRGGHATVRHKKPENWLAAVAAYGHGIAEQRLLKPHEQASEALLMGLRLAEGVDLSALSLRFGIPAQGMIDSERLAFHASLGLVRQEGERIIVTDAGMPLLDALLGELVAEALVAA